MSSSASAPESGETGETVVASDDLVIEHILSGRLDSPVAYEQDHDEWVVVLEGSALLEVAGETLAMNGGDWLLLARGTPHRLVQTRPGTRWLAVRFGW